MTQNRNKLIDLFIGNLSNAILHKILEKAILSSIPEIAQRYNKEVINSWQIALNYRQKINPQMTFPLKDIFYIKEKLSNRIRSELSLRIFKGYKNINLELVDKEINDSLKQMRVIDS